MLLNVVVSWLLLVVHLAWHCVLLGFAPYGSLLKDYELVQTIGFNLGLVSYQDIDPFMAVHYIAPEVRTVLSICLVSHTRYIS